MKRTVFHCAILALLGLGRTAGAVGATPPRIPAADGFVMAVAFDDPCLVVGGGGAVAVIADQRHDVLAMLDVDRAGPVPDGWTLPQLRSWPVVQAVALLDDRIIMGGRFDIRDPLPRRHLVALDRKSGAVREGFDLGSDDLQVWVMLQTGHGVFCGHVGLGMYDQASMPSPRYFTAFALDGARLDWAPAFDGPVYALAERDGILYVGGDFAMVDDLPRANLVAFDLASGALLPWTPDASAPVRALHAAYGSVYAGGFFGFVGGQRRTFVAALDARTGEALPWNPRVDGPVLAIHRHADHVFLGGMFATVNAEARNLAAAVSAADGRVLAFDPRLACAADPRAPVGAVHAILPLRNALLIGGTFTTPAKGTALVCFDTGALLSEPASDIDDP